MGPAQGRRRPRRRPLVPDLTTPHTLRPLLAVLAGAALLLWPALVNGYPILFSDTGGFLEQALMPDMGWDKPWIYGPFLTPFHWKTTLWPAIGAQALILSAILWLTQSVLDIARPLSHITLCALLAVATAAPWFASTLMPDIFTPIVVLSLYVLASGRLRPLALAFVAITATLAIAVHLAHLILAAACLAVLGVLQRRIPWRQTAPLLAALALLVATNLIGNGQLAISPYGSVFALARLVANGPARTVIQHDCPQSGWRLCDWQDRLPTDSDDFLWDPNGPVWADAYGPIRIAPEAAAIVRRTLRAEPLAVLRSALANTAEQLTQVEIGDTLTATHLDTTILPRLEAYFPPAETARFAAGLQAQGRLAPLAASLNPFDTTLLALGAVATLAVAVRQWRRNRPLATLAVLVLAALCANAFATGALSHPHDRYQARIAWLVVLVPALALARPGPPRDQQGREPGCRPITLPRSR